eukprot:scaffold29901_cov63-Phaeocystis_antarctica.AAC.6
MECAIPASTTTTFTSCNASISLGASWCSPLPWPRPSWPAPHEKTRPASEMARPWREPLTLTILCGTNASIIVGVLIWCATAPYPWPRALQRPP